MIYDVEESTNRDFVEPSVEETWATRLEVSGQAPGKYYYRVRAWHGGHPGEYSNVQWVIVKEGTPIVFITPSRTTASWKEPVEIYVAVANVDDLGAFEFTLRYDPSVAIVEDVAIGEFPGSTGRTFNTTGPSIDNDEGAMSFGATSVGSTPPGASGSGTLAVITMLPTGRCSTVLRLKGVVVRDVSGEEVDVEVENCALLVVRRPTVKGLLLALFGKCS